MRARLQRNRVIRCRLGHEAAASSVFGLLAAVVWVALAAAAFAFGAASGAAWPPSFDPNRLLKKLPVPPELEGAADATCTDDRGAETGVDSTEAKLNVFLVEASAGGET